MHWLADILEQYRPVGFLEEMFVEKIVVSYWRLRRASRYEVGTLRSGLDNTTDDYYENRYTDAEIDEKIQESQESIKALKRDHKKFTRLYTEEVDLKEIYDEDELWARLFNDYLIYSSDDEEIYSSQWVRDGLKEREYTDDEIWEMFIDSFQQFIDQYRQNIEKFKKDKVKNRLYLQVVKKINSLPPILQMNNLLRYETAIDRQLYRAIDKLERLQRLRTGDHVPPPLQVDLNINDTD